MTEIAHHSFPLAAPTTSPQIYRLGRIAATIPVQDMSRAQDFYIQLLGFEKSFENGSPVGFSILSKGPTELHLTLQPNHQPAKFNVAHMMVENIESLYEHFLKNDVRIIKSIQDKEFGLRAFVFEDPEGNRIDIGQNI